MEHLPQLGDVGKYLGILQQTCAAGCGFEPRRAQIGAEQGQIRKQAFAPGCAQIIEQRQQGQGQVIGAAAQPFQVPGQPENGFHQAVEGLIGVGNLTVQDALGELFHFLGEQSGALKLNHLECAIDLVQVVQAEAQACRVIPVLDIGFQSLLALYQCLFYFATNPVQGDAVMVVAHNHSGYSSSDWRRIHASTCSEGTRCNPGGCHPVISPCPNTSKPPGARCSASLVIISRRRQRRK